MTNKLILALLILATSCGNPHTYSGNELEKTGSPLETDVNCYYEGQVEGVQFIENLDEKFKKCKSVVSEDFNSFEVGTYKSLTNEKRETFSYALSHQYEKAHGNEKVEYLEDIFESSFNPLSIEASIELNGVTGKDQGVLTQGTKASSKNGLVWSFNNRISFFMLHTMALKAGSKLRLFSCDETLIQEQIIPVTSFGRVQTYGFVSQDADICHVSLSAGEDMSALALDEFHYGNLTH